MPLPKWPPPAGEGFIYPTMEKKQQELLDLGVATGCSSIYAQEPPYAQPKASFYRPPPGPVIDIVNPNQCPPGGAVSSGNVPAGADPHLASRIAAKILGLPLSQPQLQQPQNPPTALENPPVSMIRGDFPGDFGDDSNSPAPAPVPAPSPGPYDKSQCLLDNSKFNIGEVVPCTWNTLEGIVYDIQHWKQLPRDGTLNKLQYVFTRDDRIFYLIVVFITFVVVILILRMLLGGGGRSHRSESAYGGYPFQAYAQCPPPPPPQIVAVPIQVPSQWAAPVSVSGK